MNKFKKLIILVLFSITILSLKGCLWGWSTIIKRDGLIIFRGKNTVSGETFIIEEGTTVRFEDVLRLGFEWQTSENIFTNDAKIVAQGTAENPIIFEVKEGHSEGVLILDKTCSPETIFEYCEFRDGAGPSVECSAIIQKCKFINSSIGLGYDNPDSHPIVQYNSAENESGNPNPLSGTWLSACGTSEQSGPIPLIQYNTIEGFRNGIIIYAENCDPVYVRYNNITFTESYAISAGPEVIMEYNYIANCYGFPGADTTGEQIKLSSGTYTNPQTLPIDEAGCGW